MCIPFHTGTGAAPFNATPNAFPQIAKLVYLHAFVFLHQMDSQEKQEAKETNPPTCQTQGEEETKQACTKIDKTRQDKTRQDKTRQDKTRQDKTRQDKTRQDRKEESERERERTNGSNSLRCWIKGATDTTVYSDFSFAIVFLSFSNPERMKLYEVHFQSDPCHEDVTHWRGTRTTKTQSVPYYAVLSLPPQPQRVEAVEVT